MPMGRERAVLRWNARASLAERELARVAAALSELANPATPEERQRRAELEVEREEALSRLRALGPSPRAKMG
jgi:hypothetical protein